MTYTYDISTSKKDNRSTVCLSVCHLLFSIISLFTSTFLVAHIYSLTDDIFEYTLNVALYEFSAYIVMLIAYYLFSFWVDKSNRIWVYRVGNIINTIFVIITIFFGKDLAKIIVLAGALKGLSHAAYYASYNVLKQEMVSRKSMTNVVGVLTILGKVVNLVCPIVLGALIDVSTFSMVAIYVAVISVALLVVSFFISAKKPQNSGFSVRNYLKRLKTNEKFKVKTKKLYVICIFFGFFSVSSSLLSVNIMMQFGSNFSLGAITSIFALVSIVTLILFKRFTKPGGRSWILILGTILPSVSSILFAAWPNIATLIIYHLCVNLTKPLGGMLIDIYRNKNLKEYGFYQDIAEHQCVVESILQFSRIASYGLLILFSLFKNYILLQIAFVVFACLFSIMNVLLMKYEKDEQKEKQEAVLENSNPQENDS